MVNAFRGEELDREAVDALEKYASKGGFGSWRQDVLALIEQVRAYRKVAQQLNKSGVCPACRGMGSSCADIYGWHQAKAAFDALLAKEQNQVGDR